MRPKTRSRGKARRADSDDENLEDDEPPRKGRRIDDDAQTEFKIDAAGIVGDTVQIPSFVIWKVIQKAVESGTKDPKAIVRALGGRVVGADVSEMVTLFTIECILSICASRDDVPSKANVRVLHAGKWTFARLKFVGGCRYAQLPGGVSVELTSQSWWYHYVPSTEQAGVRASGDVARTYNLRLTGRAPTEAVVEARKLLAMDELAAVAALVKRMGGLRAIGDRMACLAILAINEFQTDTELLTGQAIDRNNRGWGNRAAPVAHGITAAIAARRLLTREEMDKAHEIVSQHAAQLLRSRHLAEVLSFGCPKEKIVADEADDDEDLSDEEFIAPEDPEPPRLLDVEYPETNDAWAADFGITEQVFRVEKARLLNYTAYQFVKVLRDQHGGDFEAILKEMRGMWPAVTDLDVHVALGHLGKTASAPGQKVASLWTDGFEVGKVEVCEPGYVFCSYPDGDRLPLDALQMSWHYVVS